MTTRADRDRMADKVSAIAARIKEIAPNADIMLRMLDETKLDLLILALGLGETVIHEPAD